jgi:hypothetical protein
VERQGGGAPDPEGWQGRKDSNLGPSVLETDALTRLSYAPIGLTRAARAGRPTRILAHAQRLSSGPV